MAINPNLNFDLVCAVSFESESKDLRKDVPSLLSSSVTIHQV